jgi:hypothetical protein
MIVRSILTVTALASSILVVAPASAAGTPRSGANSPTLDNNASCMAQARAQYNSTGGNLSYGVDRTKGFGKVQSDFVEDLNSDNSSFGEWLQDSLWASRDTCPE